MFQFNLIFVFFFQKFDFLLNFLINYHIIMVFVLILVIYLFSYNYFFKIGVGFLSIYIYMYWAICLSICILNIQVYGYMYINLYNLIIFMVLGKFNSVLIDLKCIYFDFLFYLSGFLNFFKKPGLFWTKFYVLFTQFNDRRKYILKKYVYTINHKRIAINYFFLVCGLVYLVLH